jgi:hypothetical protein
MDDLRIAVKPQRLLWYANLVIQPALCAMCVMMALHVDGVGMAIFAWTLCAATLSLFAFSALVVARTRGKSFEIAVTPDAIEVPDVLRGTSTRIPLAAIRRVRISELATDATSFWSMQIDTATVARGYVQIHSQFVGNDAFFRLRDALVARAVPIG